MEEVLEIQQVIEHLQGVLENLVTRGLGAAGAAERNALATLGEEFTRIGAGHLAERVAALHEALENDLPDGPVRLLKAQASLRLFERVLTLEIAGAALASWQTTGAEGEGADEPDPD